MTKCTTEQIELPALKKNAGLLVNLLVAMLSPGLIETETIKTHEAVWKDQGSSLHKNGKKTDAKHSCSHLKTQNIFLSFGIIFFG